MALITCCRFNESMLICLLMKMVGASMFWKCCCWQCHYWWVNARKRQFHCWTHWSYYFFFALTHWYPLASEPPRKQTYSWGYELSSLTAVDFQRDSTYHEISITRYTKSQNLNDSCLVLQLSLPNPLKPGREWTIVRAALTGNVPTTSQ